MSSNTACAGMFYLLAPYRVCLQMATLALGLALALRCLDAPLVQPVHAAALWAQSTCGGLASLTNDAGEQSHPVRCCRCRIAPIRAFSIVLPRALYCRRATISRRADICDFLFIFLLIPHASGRSQGRITTATVWHESSC